jgi:hypothetical protein
MLCRFPSISSASLRRTIRVELGHRHSSEWARTVTLKIKLLLAHRASGNLQSDCTIKKIHSTELRLCGGMPNASDFDPTVLGRFAANHGKPCVNSFRVLFCLHQFLRGVSSLGDDSVQAHSGVAVDLLDCFSLCFGLKIGISKTVLTFETRRWSGRLT